jgi:hypothetical protein
MVVWPGAGIMEDRTRFFDIMSFRPVDRVPNHELAPWSQTYDRRLSEGLPRDTLYENRFEGEPHFGLDHRALKPIKTRILPGLSTRCSGRTTGMWRVATRTAS